MKDSGVEWISQIPRAWRMVPNYAVMSEVKDIVGNKADEYTLLSLTKQGVIVRDLDAGGKFPTSFDKYKTVVPGQMIFCLFDIDETPRTVGLSHNHGMITGAYDVFDINDDVCDSRYLLYYYLIVDDGKHLRPYYASLRKTVTPTAFRHIKMPLPPLAEQQLIADYLDERCAAIDEVRHTLTDEIEALRRLRKATIYRAVTKGLDESVSMRDSGVEWIGEVPSTWKTRKLKYLFEIVKRIAGKEGFDVLAITQQGIRVKDITNSEGQQLAKDYSGYQFVYPGDFAMNHMDLITGWVDCSALFGVTSPDYRVFRPMKNRQINRDYFRYVFQNCYLNRIFYNLGNGVSGQGRWRLQAPAFNNFVVPLPPLSEQQRIADYLDERCTAIDSIIDTRTKQLERLEDYRRALIFAYVTGKKEVPSHE